MATLSLADASLIRPQQAGDSVPSPRPRIALACGFSMTRTGEVHDYGLTRRASMTLRYSRRPGAEAVDVKNRARRCGTVRTKAEVRRDAQLARIVGSWRCRASSLRRRT